jgi:hypothetical protein
MRFQAAPPPLTEADSIGQAQDMLQTDEPDLDDGAMLAVFDLFKSNPLNAQMYIRIRKDSLRKRWVRRELEKMNFVLPDEPVS